jgi:hypothetical protein
VSAPCPEPDPLDGQSTCAGASQAAYEPPLNSVRGPSLLPLYKKPYSEPPSRNLQKHWDCEYLIRIYRKL